MLSQVFHVARFSFEFDLFSFLRLTLHVCNDLPVSGCGVHLNKVHPFQDPKNSCKSTYVVISWFMASELIEL